jgi:hypothetical protein
MKIQHLVDSLGEGRKNNWGREQSNAAGQDIARQVAAGQPQADTNAQIQQARSTQAPSTNTGDTLGQTTPAQRLALQRAQQAASGTTTTAPTTNTTPSSGTTTTAPTTNTAPTDTAQPQQAPKTPTDWKGAWDTVKNVAGAAKDATVGTIKGAGDIASQVAGGVTQTAGAALGGLGAGYHTARQRKSFGSTQGGYGLDKIGNPNNPDPYYAPGGGGTVPASTPASTPTSTAAGDAEIANLKASIQKIDQRLSAAKIPESKKR